MQLFCSWQKKVGKQISNCGPVVAEYIQLFHSVQRKKMRTKNNSTRKSWANIENSAKCTLKHFDVCDRNLIISKLVLNSFMALQEVMPFGNVLHCSYNCQVRICDTLRLFCSTSTILFSLWCMIFITRRLWFQHMFMGTGCYLLHSKQCLMQLITMTGN